LTSRNPQRTSVRAANAVKKLFEVPDMGIRMMATATAKMMKKAVVKTSIVLSRTTVAKLLLLLEPSTMMARIGPPPIMADGIK
jgi:hypothetical protein